jgi:predicted RNA-binding Zn ribbon-like protein
VNYENKSYMGDVTSQAHIHTLHSVSMKPLFLGGQPAIDFLNTAMTPDGVAVETIPDGRAFLEWLVGAGLLSESEASKLSRRFGAKGLDTAATEARKVREWARDWVVRWRVRPAAAYGDEIATLNKLLAREASTHELVATREGLKLEERPQLESAPALISLVAMQLAALLTTENAALIRDCAGTGCTLTFIDRTKAHRRMFCSAAACGNRAKVAAFRSRQRG